MRKPVVESFPSQERLDVGEAGTALVAIPWHDGKRGIVLMSDAAKPCDGDGVGEEGEGAGALDGLARSGLGTLEAELLFGVAEGDFERPALGVGLRRHAYAAPQP